MELGGDYVEKLIRSRINQPGGLTQTFLFVQCLVTLVLCDVFAILSDSD